MAATVGLVIRSLQLLSLPLSIPFLNEGERERTLAQEGGVVVLYKEIRGYIDIGRLLLLRLLR